MRRPVIVILVLLESILLAYFLFTNLSSYYSAYTIVKRGADIFVFSDTLVLSESIKYKTSGGNTNVLMKGTEIDVYGINNKGSFMEFRPSKSDENWDSSKSLTIDMVEEKDYVYDILEQLKDEKDRKLGNLMRSCVLVYLLFFIISLGILILISFLFKTHLVPHFIIVVVLVVCVAFFSPIYLAR